MKNVKSLAAGTLILGALFLTSCQSSKTGCYYSETKVEQTANPATKQALYSVKPKTEISE